MTQKYTPGPWFVPDQTFARILTVEAGDGVACPGSGGAMSYTTEICTLGWQGTPEWDANARLIAAAPDMLEALRLALELFENGLVDFGKYGLETDADIGKLYQAAIARATGESK